MTEFDPASRSRLFIDVALDFTPVGSTVELRVGTTWYAATWVGTPAQVEDVWEATALTTNYFVGPDADQGTATPLADGDHPAAVRVTQGQQITVTDCEPIHVR